MSWLAKLPLGRRAQATLSERNLRVILSSRSWCQIRAKKFHPFLYWLTIVATTNVGTTLPITVRSLGIGYTGGSTICSSVWLRRF